MSSDLARPHRSCNPQTFEIHAGKTIEDMPTADTNLGTKTHLVYAVLVDQGQL
jgi:hypothetical protein